MSHLFLIGYRATGKTSVAKLLSSRLELPTSDVDEGIEALAGRRVSEIFSQDGEAHFRKLETEVLRNLVAQPPSVISIGGGTIETDLNRELIKESGVCVWLRATPETILQRIENDTESATLRPALTSLPMADEIRVKLGDRTPIYRELASKIIDVDANGIEDIATQIATWWQSAG